MSKSSQPLLPSNLVALADMTHGQEADCFALLTGKEELTTREGKPYWRVTFRDARREVTFPVWDNSPWAAECRERWAPGAFFKLRAVFRESNYGPQLEIRKIREVCDADRADGFDPLMCQPRSRFDFATMMAELREIVAKHIDPPELRKLVEWLLTQYEAVLLQVPAARRNHHACAGGWLEHTLSVTRTCVYLAEKYADYYSDMQPPLHKGLVVAGGVLHDIGKVREIRQDPAGTVYTPEGELLGHMLLGRDMVREAAAAVSIDPTLQLRLEHVVIAHQRLPEWGAPKPPMIPEALLVHYADDIDAKFHMVYAIYRDDASEGPMTSDKNILRQRFFRG